MHRGLVGRLRARRDARTDNTLGALRAAVRRAPIRRRAWWALFRSAMRMHARRAAAGALASVVGMLGMVTSPLGRWLGWDFLVHPGRRLYRRLVWRAREQRAVRDEAIRALRGAEEAAADAATTGDVEEVADHVERPARRVPDSTVPLIGEGMSSMSGFRFEEAAAEMEQQAGSYEPEGCMEILAMVEGLPAALECVANVMKVLAERSDSEFPLEKAVADGFDDMYGAMKAAVAVADDMGPLFRDVHAQDIARHEDPRNGHEAEKGWNV